MDAVSFIAYFVLIPSPLCGPARWPDSPLTRAACPATVPGMLSVKAVDRVEITTPACTATREPPHHEDIVGGG